MESLYKYRKHLAWLVINEYDNLYGFYFRFFCCLYLCVSLKRKKVKTFKANKRKLAWKIHRLG